MWNWTHSFAIIPSEKASCGVMVNASAFSNIYEGLAFDSMFFGHFCFILSFKVIKPLLLNSKLWAISLSFTNVMRINLTLGLTKVDERSNLD